MSPSSTSACGCGETAERLSVAASRGQRSTRRHVRSHVGMLRIAWQRSDVPGFAGQLARIVAAALCSRLWVPVGNTGGANVRVLRPMPVPPDLQAILDANRR
ncbi:MAG: DUF3703 domain-containing protein [Proteobacteria bacterium]|nr:DUF3703 domain-containing protein [Pseudomonadota bacterium]MBP6107781.1 DUF3703 domain-containing protein [Steroidobacteraceae bacterium]MBP7015060.1 DUF3703 domain-containing protein [Steroidobacteraceae bacterium]